MNRVFLRQVLASLLPVFGVGAGGLWLITALGITANGALLAPVELLAVATLMLLSRLHWVVALAACWGVASVLARWREEGALLSHAAVGGRLAALLPSGLAVGVAVVACFVLFQEGIGPQAQTLALRMVHERASLSVPADGELYLGEARAIRDADGAVWLVEGERVVRAEQASVNRGVLELGAGELWTQEGRVRWSGWRREVAAQRRIMVDELPTGAVMRRAYATEASGGDSSYEWAIVYKRGTVSLAFSLLPLVLMPLATTGWWRAWVVGILVGVFVSVRVGDAASMAGLAEVGALLPLLWLAVPVAVGWRRW